MVRIVVNSENCEIIMSKRKLWSNESMKAAVAYVNDGNAVREAGRLYNVPVETLR